MSPTRAQRRAKKRREWRHANQLYHEEETLKGTRLVLATRERRIGESKIARWHRRRRRITPYYS